MSCPYKDIFGVPNQGFHATRFLGLALYDVLGTLAIIVVLSFWLNPLIVTPLVIASFIFIHWALCVPTALNKALGLAS
ncbi:hypothetical protein QKT49_gp105 [Acanthamoeba castellanii medusavirus]|uniref:Uncharacterized protein n=1 Tax=Acanthamoeba castellanii medusavirus J1 TaxID=3114988 RepID=A0A3T1CWR5_9VIRU|nr:hypothetical protein QKT49_gp105 [Acanthamoeba castellanii medusavirus]BBI30245.1 hypothetical protein [Acanthamoeba castellanii medusavirus J1]